jgi:hypothetical protein
MSFGASSCMHTEDTYKEIHGVDGQPENGGDKLVPPSVIPQSETLGLESRLSCTEAYCKCHARR